MTADNGNGNGKFRWKNIVATALVTTGIGAMGLGISKAVDTYIEWQKLRELRLVIDQAGGYAKIQQSISILAQGQQGIVDEMTMRRTFDMEDRVLLYRLFGMNPVDAQQKAWAREEAIRKALAKEVR